MKHLTVFIFIFIFCLTQFLFASDKNRLEKVNWAAFSKNLVNGLTFENDGVRQAVLQHIITYADYLDVDDGVLDMMRIYRHHRNEKFRQLAVVALTKTHNNWAMGFLKRNIKFEKNPTIRRQIIECLRLHQQQMSNNDKLMAETLAK